MPVQDAAQDEDCLPNVGTDCRLALRSFPAAHVAFRLEQAAAGSWPSRHPAAPDPQRVPRALCKVRRCLSGLWIPINMVVRS